MRIIETEGFKKDKIKLGLESDYKIKNWIEWVEMNVWWPIGKILDIPQNWLREIKWGWQRARRGFSDRDVWGIDEWITGVLANALKQLALIGMTYPGVGKFDTEDKWRKFLLRKVKFLKDYHYSWKWEDENFPYNGTSYQIREYSKKRRKRYLKQCKEIRELFTAEVFGNLWD